MPDTLLHLKFKSDFKEIVPKSLMPLWGVAKLTPSKAVQLSKGEIVFAVGNAGRFCKGETVDKPLQGHITLTTHRVVLVAEDRSTTGSIHLSRVVTVELKSVRPRA